MGFKILAINPGSTSTKVALYDEERPSLDLTLRHTAEQIARYTNIIDQLGWRREMILTALSNTGSTSCSCRPSSDAAGSYAPSRPAYTKSTKPCGAT